jgi:MFS family permease
LGSRYNQPVNSLRRFISNPSVPREFRANFIHLYFDMAWFGILSGTAMSFLSVYAARLGGSGFQIGLLAGTSAFVNLILAIPASQVFQKRPVGRTVFWTSVIYRIGYLLWIPLPWLFGNQGQIWALITITLLMGIPLTVQAIGFNALFAAAVPLEWRSSVAGTRNMLYSVTYMLSALGAGWLLVHLAFPLGYQVVFGIGGLSALASCAHLFFVRIPPSVPVAPDPPPSPEPTDRKKPSVRSLWLGNLRLDIWRTPFAAVLLAMLGLHLTQYLAIPLFPLFSVNVLHLTDQSIGIGTALYYLTSMLGSTQLNRVVRRFGHRKVTGLGFMIMSFYPGLMAFTHSAYGYYLVSILGGLSWALMGSAYMNYVLENIPENDRPAHLAWYNIILNGSILVGSLLGPFIAGFIGLAAALVVAGGLRLLAGYAIFKGANDRGRIPAISS